MPNVTKRRPTRSIDPRLWARISLDILANPKLRTLEPAAKWLYVASILTARRDMSDGFVRGPAVCVDQDVDMEMAEVMVTRGLWHRAGHECPDCPQPEVGRGWVVIHDYLEHQPSRAEIEEHSANKSRAGQKGAAKRWEKAGAKASAMASAMAGAYGTSHSKSNSKSNGKRIAEEEEEITPAKSVTISSSASSQSSSSSAESEWTTDELAKITDLTGGGPAHARKTAAFVLSKAPADLRDPLAYVLAAVRNEPDAYRYRRGNPRRDQECAEHPGEWADNCRACALDRRLSDYGTIGGYVDTEALVTEFEPDWTEDLG